MTHRNIVEATQTEHGHKCPKCGIVYPTMDEWVIHVSDEHDPYGEFVARWGDSQEAT